MNHSNFILLINMFVVAVIPSRTFADQTVELENTAPESSELFLSGQSNNLDQAYLTSRDPKIESKLVILQNLLLDKSDKISVLEYKNSSLFAELTKLSSSLRMLNKRIDEYAKKTTAETKVISTEIGERVLNVREDVDLSLQSIKSVRARIASVDKNIEKRNKNIYEQISEQREVISTQSNLIAILALFLTVSVLFGYRRAQTIGGDTGFYAEQIRQDISSERIAIDLKLSGYLESQLKFESLVTKSLSENSELEIDHSFNIKVANEIHRMRKRIKIMPEGVSGIKPLSKALERLEEALNDQSYQIEDLLGQQYIEGMTVHMEIVLDENLDPGEKMITNVIKPQINFRGNIVQVADVTVTVGEEI